MKSIGDVTSENLEALEQPKKNKGDDHCDGPKEHVSSGIAWGLSNVILVNSPGQLRKDLEVGA